MPLIPNPSIIRPPPGKAGDAGYLKRRVAMPIITAFLGDMQPSNYAKELIATAMYNHGKEFIAAALLLKQRGGHGFVGLHLLCQGVEIILKALLLRVDYDYYHSKLRSIGHDLINASDEVIMATNAKRLTSPLMRELQLLNDYYSNHHLRYASVADVLIDPNNIGSERTWRRIGAIIRYLEYKKIFT